MDSTIVAMDVAEARRRAERIRLLTTSIAENVAKVRDLVHEAKASQDHLALGYASWTAYLADLFGDEPLRLTRDVRRELVAELAEQGMSTRAIAPIVGASQKTVDRDVRESNDSPAPVAEVEPVAERWLDVGDGLHLNAATGEARFDAPTVTQVTETHTVKTVTGLDGKTYERKASAERRSSIVDDSRNAGWQLRKAVERIQRIAQDDRYGKNKVEVMAALQPHLDFASEVFTDL